MQNNIFSKKQQETETVKHFLKNCGVPFDSSKLYYPSADDYIDVIYDKVKYQVTTAPADFKEVNGKLNKKYRVVSKQNNNTTGSIVQIAGKPCKLISWQKGMVETWNDFICYPIWNKKQQYGKIPLSEELTLLIDCEIDPPKEWLLSFIEFLSSNAIANQYLKRLNFKYIYLVLAHENILVFSG